MFLSHFTSYILNIIEYYINFTVNRDYSYKKLGNKGGHLHLQIF